MKLHVLAALSCFVLATSCGSRTEGLDQTKIPDDLKSDYQLFAVRCSKCHSLARPLSSGITDDQQWVDYVNRMRRQPGSGISYGDQAHILRFLKWYAAELRRKDAEKRGETAPPASSPPPEPPASAAPAATPAQDGGQ